MTAVPPAFPPAAHAALDLAYPNTPVVLPHALHDHPLLGIDALATLAARLDPAHVEFNRADLPVGIMPDDIPGNGLDIATTIRTIASNGSWAVLKFIETDPAYAALLRDLLNEIAPLVTPRTGPMETIQGFVFISSPGAMTPFHFDPEHNILLQLTGAKRMTIYPAGDPRFAAQVEHERYHAGGHRNLPWSDDFAADDCAGNSFVADLTPGLAVHVPVMSPHFVRNGPVPSVSLSITWRSEWSYREAEGHAANRWLRARGLNPPMPPRWPRHATLRSLGWRAARRLRLVR